MPQIMNRIYLKSFNGIKRQGMVDLQFLEPISGTMTCLMCAMPCHAQRALQTGIYKILPDFKHVVVEGKGV